MIQRLLFLAALSVPFAALPAAADDCRGCDSVCRGAEDSGGCRLCRKKCGDSEEQRTKLPPPENFSRFTREQLKDRLAVERKLTTDISGDAACLDAENADHARKCADAKGVNAKNIHDINKELDRKTQEAKKRLCGLKSVPKDDADEYCEVCSPASCVRSGGKLIPRSTLEAEEAKAAKEAAKKRGKTKKTERSVHGSPADADLVCQGETHDPNSRCLRPFINEAGFYSCHPQDCTRGEILKRGERRRR